MHSVFMQILGSTRPTRTGSLQIKLALPTSAARVLKVAVVQGMGSPGLSRRQVGVVAVPARSQGAASPGQDLGQRQRSGSHAEWWEKKGQLVSSSLHNSFYQWRSWFGAQPAQLTCAARRCPWSWPMCMCTQPRAGRGLAGAEHEEMHPSSI